MLGVHGLNWHPTGPEAVIRILEWAGFVEFHVMRWVREYKPGTGRFGMVASKKPGLLDHWKSKQVDARDREPRIGGRPSSCQRRSCSTSLRQAPVGPLRRSLARQAERGRHQQGDARDPPGAARGGRQLPRRQAVHDAVKERALGHEVMDSLNPGQQVVKVVNEELTALMGESSRQITLSPTPPTVILMAGLQGSGKTTACGKLARAAEGGRQGRRARGLRRLPPGRGRPARQGRRPGGRDRLRAGHRPRPARHRRVGGRPGQARRPGCRDRRHLRPPARRRGPDEGARRHQEADRSPTTCSWSSTR